MCAADKLSRFCSCTLSLVLGYRAAEIFFCSVSFSNDLCCRSPRSFLNHITSVAVASRFFMGRCYNISNLFQISWSESNLYTSPLSVGYNLMPDFYFYLLKSSERIPFLLRPALTYLSALHFTPASA